MTEVELRDHFAAQAISNAAVSLHGGINEREGFAAEISAAAYKLADAMLTERLKGLSAPPTPTQIAESERAHM